MIEGKKLSMIPIIALEIPLANPRFLTNQLAIAVPKGPPNPRLNPIEIITPQLKRYIHNESIKYIIQNPMPAITNPRRFTPLGPYLSVKYPPKGPSRPPSSVLNAAPPEI
jgi:hypothetical protein